MKKLALALLATAVLAGCKTSPTGRTQIALYSEQQMSEMGTASFAQMKESQPINKDAKTNAYVNCIAEKVVAVLPKEYASQNWEVVVFEDESANAFALPGGYIGVHTGLLKIATNQDQLATVLGHEVGKEELKLIPYYAWNNRGDGSMIVWFPTKSDMIQFSDVNGLNGKF